MNPEVVERKLRLVAETVTEDGSYTFRMIAGKNFSLLHVEVDASPAELQDVVHRLKTKFESSGVKVVGSLTEDPVRFRLYEEV